MRTKLSTFFKCVLRKKTKESKEIRKNKACVLTSYQVFFTLKNSLRF